jgi:hypothetical protein
MKMNHTQSKRKKKYDTSEQQNNKGKAAHARA